MPSGPSVVPIGIERASFTMLDTCGFTAWLQVPSQQSTSRFMVFPSMKHRSVPARA